MFKKIGRAAASRPWTVCGAWLAAGLVLSLAAPVWDSRTHDDDVRFLPDRCASVRGYRLLEQAFPQDVFASRAIFAVERRDASLTEADFALVDRCVAKLEQLKKNEPGLKIGRIVSRGDGLIGTRLTSEDGRCTLIQVSLGTPYLALQTRETVDRADAVIQQLVAETPNPPQVFCTGPAGIGRDLIRASAHSLEGTTAATIVLVIVVLLLVYRSPVLALIPLVTIACSVWVALQLLALLTLIPGVHLVNVAKIFAIVILYGAGTDYCLFLISRYQEELGKGFDVPTALKRGVGEVGGALAASAGTVICGLGLMGFAEFAKVRCAGPAIALSLGVALAASLTLAPALLRLVGRWAFWPGMGPTRTPTPLGEQPRHARLWERLSDLVVRRPVAVWSVSVAVLLPLAVLGIYVTPNYKPTGELSPLSPSVQGVSAIQRHFTAGEIGPLTVLLASRTNWDTEDGREIIHRFSRGFAHLPNVAEVRSLTQPLGKPMRLEPPPRPEPVVQANGFFGGLLRKVNQEVRSAINTAARSAHDFYVAEVGEGKDRRYVTRLDIVMKSDPFDSQSQATLQLIRLWLDKDLPEFAPKVGPVQAECYGVTVSSSDLATITEADRTRVNFLVLGGIFAILLWLVRKPWLAAYLLATVLFSYLATLGATAIVGTLWSGRPLGQVDWRVPFFLFTILVAVGEDYNIFLMARVLEERKKHGNVEGTRRALAHTGGTITSCGLIMAGTFATLVLGGLGTLVQIGFALAFGVLIDTFIVRPFLVPAFTLFVWKKQDEAAAARFPEPAAPIVLRKAS
jgi:RND superfamily putative drug exporter